MKEKEPQQGAVLQKLNEQQMDQIVADFRARGLAIEHDGEYFVVTRKRESDGAEVKEHVLARRMLAVTDSDDKNSKTSLVPIEKILETSVRFSFDEYEKLGTYELLKRLSAAERSDKKQQ